MQDIHWWWWCLGNNSHYCVRVMFHGGLYRLIHSIPTIPLEVGTVTASILEIRNCVGDRQAACSTIAGIRVQTSQEHSEFTCIHTTPPRDRKLGEVRKHLSAVLDPLQSRYRATYVNIHCQRLSFEPNTQDQHDGDPFSLCDWLVKGSVPALCESTLLLENTV